MHRQGTPGGRRSKRRRILALTLALSLVGAGTAAASLLSTVLPAPGSSPSISLTVSSPLLEPVVGGERQSLDALCPTAENAGALLPIGSLTDSLSSGACTAGSLDFRFQTRLKTSTGEIVRSQVAIANVPAPLNVDNDVAPDVVGTLGVLSLTEFTLRIDRALGEAATLPLSVEAIVDDPTNGSLPRDRINFGYDARDASAPALWRSKIALQTAARDSAAITLDMQQDTTTAGTELALVGGLFDGPAEDRVDPMGGRLSYSPVPPSSTVGLTIGNKLGLRLGASLPVTLTGDAQLVDGTHEQVAHAVVQGLPRSMSLDYQQLGEGRRTATYTAATPVPSIAVDYSDRTDGAIGQRAVINAEDLPTGMTVKQTAARAANFTATGGSLGSVEVGFANGDPRLLDVDGPYGHVVEEGALDSYAGRVDDLRSASFDATGAIVVDAELDERHPFVVKVTQPGRTIDGTLTELPRKAHIGLDLDGGTIEYDGKGETIDEIDVDARQDEPFFDRVKRIDGTVEDLPPVVTVSLKPEEAAGAGFKASAPIGKVTALLTSGPEVSLPGDERGFVLEDFDDRFVVFGRMTGLSEAKMTDTGPITVTAKVASQPLTAIYREAGMTVEGRTSPVPDDITLTYAPAAGSVVYKGSAGIDWLDTTVTSDSALFGRVKRIDGYVGALPKDVTIGFKPAAGEGGSFNAKPDGVGLIEAELTDGEDPDLPALLPDGRSGVVFADTADRFSVVGRIRKVKEASVTLADGGVTAGFAADEAQPFDLDLTMNEADDAVEADARIVGKISALPKSLGLTTAGAAVQYRASSGIASVELTGSNLPGDAIDGKPHEVRATLQGVPAAFDIVAGGSSNGVRVVGGGAFTRVDAEIWDHGDRLPAFDEDGRNKASLVTRNGRLHAKLRLFDLQKGVLGDGALGGHRIESGFGSAPAPLDLDLHTGTDEDPSDVTLTGSELPTQPTVNFRKGETDGTRISYWGNADTADIHAVIKSAGLSADLHVPDVPSETHFCVGADLQCDAQAPQRVRIDDKLVLVKNDTNITVFSNGVATLSGHVCLPPTDDEGEPTGEPAPEVCDAGALNRVEMNNVRMQRARLEIAGGDSDDEKDGEPVADGLLKAFIDTDASGIKMDSVVIENKRKDDRTVLSNPGDPALRSLPDGQPFFIVLDLDLPPSIEEWNNRQIACGGFSVIIQALGTTWDAIKIVKNAQSLGLLPEICKF